MSERAHHIQSKTGSFNVGDEVSYKNKTWLVSEIGDDGSIALSPYLQSGPSGSHGGEIEVDAKDVKNIKPIAKYGSADKKQIEIEIGKGAKVGTLNVKESFLASLEESIILKRLEKADDTDIKNAFFANYVTALLFLKIQDLKGLRLINDHGHANLQKFSPHMSDLNFWARAMFHADDNEVKSRIAPEDALKLIKAAKKVSTSRVQKIMKTPLTAPDAIVWDEAISAILLLQHIFSVQSSYFNTILRTLYKWDTSTFSVKQKAINDSLMFMMQSDPTSKVLPHLRMISNLIATKQFGTLAQKVVGFAKLNETDAGGATSTAAVASTNAIIDPRSGTTNSQTGWGDTKQNLSNDLGGLYRLRKLSPEKNSSKQNGKYKIRDGKTIKRIERKFVVKKFKAPVHLKPKKSAEQPKSTPSQTPESGE